MGLLKKRIVSAGLASIMVLSMAACTGNSTESTTAAALDGSNGSSETTQAAAGGETVGTASAEIAIPTEVTMMVNYNGAEAPTDDNPIIKIISEQTGANVKVNWIPQSAYSEKLNTLIASKDPETIKI